MRKGFAILAIICILLGSGLWVGKFFFSQEEKQETTTTSTEKEVKPALWLETKIMASDQKMTEEKELNDIYQGDLTFHYADPQKTYLVTVKLLSKEGNVFAGPDKKPLEQQQEVVLGKEEGTIHLVLKGNRPMIAHISQLKDVQATAKLEEKTSE